MWTMDAHRFLLAALAAILLIACGPATQTPDLPDGNASTCEELLGCSGHGVCTVSGGVATCTCAVGWAGMMCDVCAEGYVSDGNGNCMDASDPCAPCSTQHRECVSTSPSLVCGDCLQDFNEVNGRCYQTCAASSNTGELVPLDLYIMLDRSSSMQDSAKWTSVKTALSTFVSSPEVAGIGIGLQFFPLQPSGPVPTSCDDCGLYGPCVPVFNVCAGSMAADTSCDPGDYDAAAVDIAELPGAQATFTSAINAESPDGSATPTEPAMSGAVTYAQAWAAAHPGHLTFIVFATDGEPTGCTTNSINGTAALAQAAANAAPPVKTFVIGVGSSLSSLNAIASAGGTGSAYLVDTGNATQQFIDALNDIRINRDCKYQLPQPDGEDLDPSMVNVNVGEPPAPVYNVANAAACDAALGGWYYDDPSAPTMIILCPATCDQVKAGNLNVDILVGCETVVM